MVFLELRREPGVYFRVTAGMAIRNSTLFIEIRIPVNFQEESGLITFEALNSTSLSRCQQI